MINMVREQWFKIFERLKIFILPFQSLFRETTGQPQSQYGSPSELPHPNENRPTGKYILIKIINI